MNALLDDAKTFIEQRLSHKPKIALILGSGLGSLADKISNPIIIPYNDIPHFPISTVEGHKGQFVFGELEGKQVVAMQGRFHYYEGYGIEQIVFPVRVLRALGTERLIVTNAAGGVNVNYRPGDLMLIKDHLNFSNPNPLTGPNYDQFGVRFPEMSEPYSARLRNVAKEVASKQNMQLREGVYYWYSGPSYETPAEIRMIRTVGADAVGMSTVPEVIVAKHGGMEVLGITCITNMACGILDQPLSHAEVIETAEKIKEDFITLIKGIVSWIETI